MRADQDLGSLLHSFGFKGPKHPSSLSCEQWRSYGVIVKKIMITARYSAETCMKPGSSGRFVLFGVAVDFAGPTNSNGRWQKAIDASYPGNCRALKRRIEMDDLLDRVHTGIGSACAHRCNVMAGKFLQRRFKPVLHRLAIRLSLPAMPGRSVILYTENDTFQSLDSINA